jgi:hypothetical protein
MDQWESLNSHTLQLAQRLWLKPLLKFLAYRLWAVEIQLLRSERWDLTIRNLVISQLAGEHRWNTLKVKNFLA